MATTAANSTTDPYMAAYYALQTQNVNDNYALQNVQNKDAANLANISFQQKIQALQEKLAQEQDTVSDPYANRGLLNSGIYNWNGHGQLGALQQFAHNSAEALSNLAQQQNATASSYADKGTALSTATSDQVNGLKQLQAADQARSAINDAVSAGG